MGILRHAENKQSSAQMQANKTKSVQDTFKPTLAELEELPLSMWNLELAPRVLSKLKPSQIKSNSQLSPPSALPKGSLPSSNLGGVSSEQNPKPLEDRSKPLESCNPCCNPDPGKLDVAAEFLRSHTSISPPPPRNGPNAGGPDPPPPSFHPKAAARPRQPPPQIVGRCRRSACGLRLPGPAQGPDQDHHKVQEVPAVAKELQPLHPEPRSGDSVVGSSAGASRQKNQHS